MNHESSSDRTRLPAKNLGIVAHLLEKGRLQSGRQVPRDAERVVVWANATARNHRLKREWRRFLNRQRWFFPFVGEYPFLRTRGAPGLGLYCLKLTPPADCPTRRWRSNVAFGSPDLDGTRRGRCRGRFRLQIPVHDPGKGFWSSSLMKRSAHVRPDPSHFPARSR